VNGINFEALYLQNYSDFALGQHIKFVELCKENNFGTVIFFGCCTKIEETTAQSFSVRTVLRN
jgi:hypothetical protein